MALFRSLIASTLLIVGCSCLGAQEAEPTEHVRVVRVPGDVRPVRALQHSDGTVYVVSDSDRGPVVIHTKDFGKTFSEATPLVNQTSQQPGLQFDVWDAVLAPDGQLLVALGNNAWKLNLPKDQWGFFLVRRDPRTGEITPVANINKRPSEGFSLAVNSQGTVVACWLADKLYANVSKDGGKTFGETIEVPAAANDRSLNPCNCCTTSSTFLADGRVAILYREETGNLRDMYLAIWDIEANQTTKRPVSKTPWKIDTCPMTYYSLVRDKSGLVAAWPNQRSVYLAKLSEDGKVESPGETKTVGMSGMRTGLTTLSDREERILVLWNSDARIGWQLFDRQRTPLGLGDSTNARGKGVAAFLDGENHFVILQ